MGHDTWAQFRRTISFVQGQTESLRYTYLRLNSDMNSIPGGYGVITREPQDATNPSMLSPPRNIHPNSPNIIQALDGALSELRTLEMKYMLDRDSHNTNTPTLDIPFLLRLRFRIKGKRALKATLAELEKRNEDMKAMIKELREIVRWNLEISTHQIPKVPTAGHITLEPSLSIPSIPNSSLDTPPVDTTLPPVDKTFSPVDTTLSLVDTTLSPVDTTLPPVDAALPPAHASMPPRVGGTAEIGSPPRPSSFHARLPFASSKRRTSPYGEFRYSGSFQSSGSFISHEREDNYSTHTGDKICTQCHQVWRRD